MSFLSSSPFYKKMSNNHAVPFVTFFLIANAHLLEIKYLTVFTQQQNTF